MKTLTFILLYSFVLATLFNLSQNFAIKNSRLNAIPSSLNSLIHNRFAKKTVLNVETKIEKPNYGQE